MSPGIEQERWHRARLVAGLSVLAVIGFGLLSAIPSVKREAPPEPASQPEGYGEYAQMVAEVERSWRPEVRARVLAAARLRRTEYTPALMFVLDHPDDPLFVRTIRIAGELEIEAARPRLAEIAGADAEVGVAAALLAAERISPWPAVELAAFLTEGGSEQRRAALTLCAQRPDRPVAAITALLASDDTSLRARAIDALGDELPADVIGRVMDLAGQDSADAPAATRLIERLRCSDAVAAELEARLASDPPGPRLASLQALVSRPGARIDAQLWQLVKSGSAEHQAQALRLLEQRPACDVYELRRATAHLAPLPRFHAARCLLRAGEREGLEVLLQLAADESPDAEAGSVPARLLLTELSGAPTHAGVQAWRDWVGQLPNDATVRLPPLAGRR